MKPDENLCGNKHCTHCAKVIKMVAVMVIAHIKNNS